MIALSDLRRILDYCPESGELTRVCDRGPYLKGSVAGSLRRDGYIHVQIGDKFLLAHRISWVFISGEWPHFQIDHRNGIRSDNSRENLRIATNKQNLENQSLSSRNTSGYRGVSFDKAIGKWIAQVKHHRRNVVAGRFSDVEEANRAAIELRLKLFTHHRTQHE